MELQHRIDSLKKEVNILKNKNSVLLTNSTDFAGERKKYLDSVRDTLEKIIKFERLKSPYLKLDDKQNLIEEMSRIGQKVSKDNNIPFSAFEEIFKDPEISTSLFSLLRFGENNVYQSEDTKENILPKKQRSKRW